MGAWLPDQLATQPSLVDAVEQPAPEGSLTLTHRPTLVQAGTQAAGSAHPYTGDVTSKATEPQPEAEASQDPASELPNLPLLDDAISYAAIDQKPTWRGWIHAATFPAAIALGVILVVLADGVAAKVSSAIFFASSLLLFGTSALYHRFNWNPKVKAVFKRIDHANIFLLIAGSYTPISVLALPPEKAAILLWLVWGGAALGIGFRIFWVGAPRWLYVPLYVLLGWAAMMFIVDFFTNAPVTMTLILIGGLLYTIGAVFYGLKRPNPFPGRFGFHELFHTCTLLAFLCHWVAIFLVAINPPVL
jgi:hemolysin III